jgi:3D-(3,5/4)-trihydroxycyclohexane-1,2-dione acylhydrolase (decyclizing)
LAAEADVVIAVGTRLQDFTTGSWSVFGNPDLRLIAINAARFDAVKHRAVAVVGDARASLIELGAALGDFRAPQAWSARARSLYADWNGTVARATAPSDTPTPSYAQVVGAVNRLAAPRDRVIAAAGGLPGELNKNWKTQSIASFDCEFGYSCMGYEIAGGWGAKMALPDDDVLVLVGDGSYLMMNSDIYSSILSGHKLIIVVCDNGGYAIIDRLQQGTGTAPFNNMFATSRVQTPAVVDFAKHAEALGALAENVTGIAQLEAALKRAKSADRTCAIVIKTDAHTWTAGDAWWDLGVPEVSERAEVRNAHAEHLAGKRKQRIGV